MKETTLKFRTESKLKDKLLKKAKRYKLSVSEIMRRKLNDDNDKHLFI
jgi:LysM repeat protein